MRHNCFCGIETMHLMSIIAFRSSTSIRAVDELANQTVWLKLSRWKRPLALHTPTSLGYEPKVLGVFEVHPLLLSEQSGCWPRWPPSSAGADRAHESQLLPLKRRSLDVHIEKIEEGHRLKRQQIKSWTGCSRSNEQLGPRHYLQKMILLSGAWLCTLRLREMNLKEEEEGEVWHLNLDIMEGITMHQLASWPGLEAS